VGAQLFHEDEQSVSQPDGQAWRS